MLCKSLLRHTRRRVKLCNLLPQILGVAQTFCLHSSSNLSTLTCILSVLTVSAKIKMLGVYTSLIVALVQNEHISNFTNKQFVSEAMRLD